MQYDSVNCHDDVVIRAARGTSHWFDTHDDVAYHFNQSTQHEQAKRLPQQFAYRLHNTVRINVHTPYVEQKNQNQKKKQSGEHRKTLCLAVCVWEHFLKVLLDRINIK